MAGHTHEGYPSKTYWLNSLVGLCKSVVREGVGTDQLYPWGYIVSLFCLSSFSLSLSLSLSVSFSLSFSLSLSLSLQARALVVQRAKVAQCTCMLPISMVAMVSLVHRSVSLNTLMHPPTQLEYFCTCTGTPRSWHWICTQVRPV